MTWLDRWWPGCRRDGLGQSPRWVVLDVESSGLDPRHDRLLAIAAIALHTDADKPGIVVADSFEVVIRQPDTSAAPDRQNILLHGIGVGAQSSGVDRALALQGFSSFVGQSGLVAFHAAFDRTLIERAFRAEGLPVPRNPWMDLEPLAGVLRPDIRARSLDEWMEALGVNCAVRHQAAADTLATAELLLKLWPALRVQCPRPSFAAAQALAEQRRWLAS